MASVFISYRRADCAHAAGRLKDHLVASLGDENVFFDVDAIGAGEDFHRKIEETLKQCDAVLVMIGENWNPATSEENTRELDDPEDWVRIEAAKALAASKKVIPILVDGTKMPEGAELPEDLAGLTKLNGVPLRSGGDFTRDSEKILDAIGRPRSHRRLVLTISIAAVLILSGVVFKFAPWENGDPVVPPTMSELIMEGMTPPDPGAGEVDLITNERLVGEKYGIINDQPWRRKALVVSDESFRAFYQPRVVVRGSQIYVLYLAKADDESDIYLYELSIESGESRAVDKVPYSEGTGYYFDSESNLAIRGDFVYYYGTGGAQGRRYRIGSGENAEPADFYPETDEGREPATSTSPNGRYIVASIGGGLWGNGSKDYQLAVRGQNESGEYAGISLYDRKTDSNSVLFQQEYYGDWSIGRIIWSDDSEKLFFDNAGAVACVWKYTLKSRILQKIVPEHDAGAPVFFRFDGHEYIVYVITTGLRYGEDNPGMKSQVMIATG